MGVTKKLEKCQEPEPLRKDEKTLVPSYATRWRHHMKR